VKKNDSAISLSDAAELAMQQRAKLFRNPRDLTSSGESSIIPTPNNMTTPPNEIQDRAQGPETRGSLGSFLKAVGVQSTADIQPVKGNSRLQKMSFASSNSVSISSLSNVQIILPSSAAHATSAGSLTNLRGCIVDMSIPTETGRPFAGLSIKHVKHSILICGNVSGAAHITQVDNSILVVAARQFRMHECHNCTVYLHANSQPIIEDCQDVLFAPLPQIFVWLLFPMPETHRLVDTNIYL
jgi:tubulin-specific chaperone C